MINHSCNVQIERIKSCINTEKYVVLGIYMDKYLESCHYIYPIINC